MNNLRNLPAVDKLLNDKSVNRFIKTYGRHAVVFCIRETLNEIRNKSDQKSEIPEQTAIVQIIEKKLKRLYEGSLKKVINTTGIIVHTNLGRAPFSNKLLTHSFDILNGYNNLEFNLDTGKRGNRNIHASQLLKFLCNTDDALVVNNNAAAVMLVLKTFAENKEVIISRGELIEIGGSFRIPEIMQASNCIMKEVGTTNKTKLSDYEKAITKDTAIIFKAHKSNYVIKGFTEEPDIKELISLGKKYNIPVVYDIGSGLLKKINEEALKNEPDVKSSLDSGVDIITFSGDKLIGGPQCGIITGKKKYIDILKVQPMLRALRVCKTTLVLLETSLKYYLNEKDLYTNNLIFRYLNQKTEDIKNRAQILNESLRKKNIDSEIVKSTGQYGGGAAPEYIINSYSVKINISGSNKVKTAFAEKMYYKLLEQQPAVLGILKKGHIYFDLLTIENDQINILEKIIYLSFLDCKKEI